MNINKEIVYNIFDSVFDNNVNCNDECNIFLSHISGNLFCLVTNNHSYNNFFVDSVSANLNLFYNKLMDILVNRDINGDGCFDYERNPENKETGSCLSRISKYFNDSTNFILVEYKKKKLTPLSFFTYKDHYLWNVCTGIKFRNKGLMSLLFKHFLTLYEDKQLDFMNFNQSQGLQLNLLRSNPDFTSVKNFYIKHNFKIKESLDDKIIMIFIK